MLLTATGRKCCRRAGAITSDSRWNWATGTWSRAACTSLHPHLFYALWVNRSQPVNGYGIKKPGQGEPRVEQIFPNTRPSMAIEKTS